MKVEVIDKCPICDSLLERVNDLLFCRNNNCSARILKRLQHFCKVLEIKGFGPKTLEKLQLESVDELYKLSRDDLEQVVGEKTADNLIKEIEKSETQPFYRILAALNIKLIGLNTARKLNQFVNSFEELTEPNLKQAGLGPKATQNLLAWLETEYPDLDLPITITPKDVKETSVASILTCISGKLTTFKTKAEAKKTLAEKGITVKDNLTKDVQFLISEENKETTKVKKAKQLNIPIVTVEELLNLLEDNLNG